MMHLELKCGPDAHAVAVQCAYDSLLFVVAQRNIAWLRGLAMGAIQHAVIYMGFHFCTGPWWTKIPQFADGWL